VILPSSNLSLSGSDKPDSGIDPVGLPGLLRYCAVSLFENEPVHFIFLQLTVWLLHTARDVLLDFLFI